MGTHYLHFSWVLGGPKPFCSKPNKKAGKKGSWLKTQHLLKNYFTSSDPHHDMLGGGCQVRVAAAQLIFAISHKSSLASHSSGEHLANIFENSSNGACSNMPKHVRIQPVKHIKETEIKHVSRPPEARSKVFATATAHAQITNALQCVTRSILCTKHAKSCQDTTCQHISRINRRHQTCQ